MEGVFHSKKKMSTKRSTPPSSPIVGQLKLTKYDENLFDILKNHEEKEKKEKEERIKRACLPLDFPTEEEFETVIIPSITKAITESGAKEQFQFKLAYMQDEWMDLTDEVMDSENFRWMLCINEWITRCFKSCGSNSEIEHVGEYVTKTVNTYFNFIETEWNKRFKVARMTIALDPTYDDNIYFMMINLEKDLTKRIIFENL